MIVPVHKSPTYMLPFPPKKSTLHEFESIGMPADSLSLQYLYFTALFLSALPLTGFPPPEVLKLHKDPELISGLTIQVRVLQGTGDPELRVAGPKQWHSARRIPDLAR